MKIGIFGGEGYLGSTSHESLSEHHEVSILERNELSLDQFDAILDCSAPRDLYKKRVRETYIKQVYRRTRIASSFEKKYIYIGSYSSSINSKSHYGRVKFICEEIVREGGGIILRTPLVVDQENPGSRFKELNHRIGILPFIFLPENSRLELELTDIEAFLLTLHSVIDSESKHRSEEILIPCRRASLNELIKMAPSFEGKKYIELGLITTKIVESCIKHLPLRKLNNLKSLMGENYVK